MKPMPHEDRPDVAAWRAMLYANDRLLKRLAEEMLRDQGLDLSWYEVLMHLGEARRAITQRELVELTLMGQSGLSRVLAKIEAAGLIRRVAVETDRRNLSVELTDRGRERLRRASPLHLQGIKRWFADPMTARQVDSIRVGLERVLHNLADDGHDPRPEPELVAIGPHQLSLSTDAVVTADAIVVRDALEPVMLTDAVRYARPEDVGELRRLLSAMTRRLDSPVEFLRADWALHRRIAQISPNEVLRRVYLSLVATLEDNVDTIVPDKTHPGYLQRRLRLHADIVEAIAESDAAAIADLVELHRLTAAPKTTPAPRAPKARRRSTT
jgi:DNA-binding MarR family transcriptional regulator